MSPSASAFRRRPRYKWPRPGTIDKAAASQAFVFAAVRRALGASEGKAFAAASAARASRAFGSAFALTGARCLFGGSTSRASEKPVPQEEARKRNREDQRNERA